MFENKVVEFDEIPKYEEVVFSSLHKDYRKIVRANSIAMLAVGLVICVVLFFLMMEQEKFYLITAVIVITFVLSILPLISYKKKKYAFRKHDVLFKKGLIFKSTHISPYIRLQHVVIKQTWYAKKLGLATLSLFTAANNNSDISIPGLTLEEAERWKSFLLNRLQELEDESEA